MAFAAKVPSSNGNETPSLAPFVKKRPFSQHLQPKPASILNPLGVCQEFWTLETIQKLRALFAAMIDAETADGLAEDPGPEVVEAERAIVWALADLLALVDGAGLSDGIQSWVVALRAGIRAVA